MARLAPSSVVTQTLPAAIAASRDLPESGFALAGVEAARQDLAATRADRLPRLSLGIDAAKYSVFSGVEDHDVRARVTLRHRLYGGGASAAREDEAQARVAAAEFAADRIAEESARDAASAWEDLRARGVEVAALRNAYLAQRRARDGYAEQFRVERGTLLELLRAEADLVAAAIAYVRGVSGADAARWMLLARTGRLIAMLGIDPA